MTDQEINEAVARELGYVSASQVPGIYYADYCHSIAAAWELIDNMTDRFDYVEVIKANTSRWSCGARNSTVWKTWESSDTAPMAICLAFLKLEA